MKSFDTPNFSSPEVPGGRYLVGVQKKADGRPDYSKAAVWIDANRQEKKTSALSPEEKAQFSSILSAGSYREKKRLLNWMAKEKGVSPDIILAEMREFAKSRINCPGKVMHFHRTSFDNFLDIIEMGALLSRSEVKKRKPEKKLPAWSASDDVMMTSDVYTKEGKLLKRGLTPHGVGASGGGVTLVFGPKIMELESYDAIYEYPTVSAAPLKDSCDVVLVQNEADRVEVSKILNDAGLFNINVAIQREWEGKHYSNLVEEDSGLADVKRYK